MRFLLTAVLFLYLLPVFSQPTSTPASGYQWIKTGSSNYNSFLVSTIPNITNGTTNFGFLLDKDPSDCSGHCGGNCDGNSKYAVSLYGINNTVPVGTNSNCEQRAIVINQWPNDFLDASVSNGATSGKVQLPISAKVTIKKSALPLTPGCGAGSGNNLGKIFGGNGPGNSTKVNVVCNYDISWSSTAFGGIISGGQSWQEMGSFTGEEPGSGNYSDYIPWAAAAFGNTIVADSVYDIPVNAIGQTGGNFEIVVFSSPSISVTREFGNADGLAESEPGMEGLADYLVEYDIWEIQQILPLRLTEFAAQLLSNHAVQLRWINNSEYNNDRYIVERSYNGRNWQQAGTVAALINPPANTGRYYFTDNTIAAAEKTIFYRLKLLEKSGTVIYSNQVIIRNAKQAFFSLVSTGAKNEYRVISGNSEKRNISVINTNGQIVKQFNLEGISNNIISLNDLTTAVYSIVIQQADKKEIIRVFVF